MDKILSFFPEVYKISGAYSTPGSIATIFPIILVNFLIEQLDRLKTFLQQSISFCFLSSVSLTFVLSEQRRNKKNYLSRMD